MYDHAIKLCPSLKGEENRYWFSTLSLTITQLGLGHGLTGMLKRCEKQALCWSSLRRLRQNNSALVCLPTGSSGPEKKNELDKGPVSCSTEMVDTPG